MTECHIQTETRIASDTLDLNDHLRCPDDKKLCPTEYHVIIRLGDRDVTHQVRWLRLHQSVLHQHVLHLLASC